MNTTDTVKVKAAVAQFKSSGDNWKDDVVTIALSTEDKVEVKFDLDLTAAALLALTLHPALSAIKARSDAQGGI